MPKYTATRIVPYNQERIFHTMMDVESYPRILPFIKSLKIEEKAKTHLSARVSVGIGPLAFSYRCKITPTPCKQIEVEMISGPFKRLHAIWRFSALSENETEVSYYLDSEFHSRVMEMAGGKIFAHQFQHAIQVFETHLKRMDRKHNRKNSRKDSNQEAD